MPGSVKFPALLILVSATALSFGQIPDPAPAFWDDFARIVESADLSLVQSYHATVAMNSSHLDPTWGLHVLQLNQRPDRLAAFSQAGLKSISYAETFGQSYCYVVELAEPSGGPRKPRSSHWSWQNYGGGPTAWLGVHAYFDDEPSARPYTRANQRYGTSAVTYPDGTPATGYQGDPADPRNSRIMDAACSKNVLGRLSLDYEYNPRVNEIDPATGRPKGPLDGLLLIPETGRYASLVYFKKDSACPIWIEYAAASTRMMAEGGVDGIWSDNFGPWDSFGRPPVAHGFGEWSVATFREHLARQFPADRLREMGVHDVTRFDIRHFLVSKAKSWGWDGRDLDGPVWRDPRWKDEPLWRAYVIHKRQVGTQALSRYYTAVKAAAREAGKPAFLVAGNDIPQFSLGWPRGDLDLVSTELKPDWDLAAGPRGMMLPPVGRFAPFYKLAREHARGRFVNIWLYHGRQKERLSKPDVLAAVYYEMLATHTLPMLHPHLDKAASIPEVNQTFFEFVERAAAEYGRRVPVEEVGVYYSSSSLLADQFPGGVHDFARQPHQFAFFGWSAALGAMHVQYRAVPEWKLDRQTLRQLRLLVIPESDVLEPETVRGVLEPWIREDGGRVIITGATGRRFGESRNFDPIVGESSIAPLTGITGQDQTPERKLTSIGKGQVLYLRKTIGLSYHLADNEPARDALLPRFQSALADVLDGGPALCLDDGRQVSGRVGLTVYEDAPAGRLFVDVNNSGVDPATDRIEPTAPIAFSLRLPVWLQGEPLAVGVLAPGDPPAAVLSTQPPDFVKIRLSSVRYYAGVVISGVQLPIR